MSKKISKFLALILVAVLVVNSFSSTALASFTWGSLEVAQEEGNISDILDKISYVGDSDVKGKVYISISNDEFFVTSDGDISDVIMSNVEIDLADLASKSLTDYNEAWGDYIFDLAQYGGESGKEPITLMHLFLYVLENYYSEGVGDLNITGNPGSSYFQNGFWGHDENLTYFVNGQYPLDAEAWGATSDHIILQDGDFANLSMFTSWEFFNDENAGYHFFVDDDTNVILEDKAETGVEKAFNVTRNITDWYGDYSTEYSPCSNYSVHIGTSLDQGDKIDTVKTDDDGRIYYTFDKAGTYYVYVDGGCNEEGICVSAPSSIKVTVEGEGESEQPGETEDTSSFYNVTVNVVPSTANVTFYSGKGAEAGNEVKASRVSDKGVVNGAHQYVLTVPQGDYSYRGTDGTNNIGGMNFKVPISGEVLASGEVADRDQTIKLVRVNYYTTNSNISSVGDYSLKIISSYGDVQPGTQYKSSYIYTPVLQVAEGNVTLYNRFITLKDSLASSYGVADVGNETFANTLTTTQTKTFTLVSLSSNYVKVPTGATVTFYNQLNNYNDTVINKNVTSVNNGDGTTTYTVKAPSFSNVTFRATMPGKVDQAGYFVSGGTASNYTFDITFPDDRTKSSTYSSDASIGLNSPIENSTYVNIGNTTDVQNELTLKSGDTFRLRSFRNTQIVNSQTANIMIEPTFNYEVISGSDVISLSPVTDRCTGNAGNNWMDLTALKSGQAIVRVTYDAIDINYLNSSKVACKTSYGATDADGVSVFVVNVNADGSDYDITWNAISEDSTWDSEFDVVYYYDEEGTFSFNPTENVTSVKVANVAKGQLGQWKNVELSGDVINVPVYNGSNIIAATTSEGTDYFVVRAKKISYTFTNNTTGQSSTDASEVVVNKGDSITVHFDRLDMPVAKMSGIYNPGYGNTNKTNYLLNGKYALSSVGTQYNYISDAKSSITFVAYEVGENVLSNGCTNYTSMGDPFGNHRNLTDNGRPANFNATAVGNKVSTIESIKFNVVDSEYQIDTTNINALKSVKIYHGASAYMTGYLINQTTQAKSKNAAFNWTKTTSAMSEYYFSATATTVDYYNTITLKVWYDGEDVQEYQIASGSEFTLTKDQFAANADKVLNIQLVVTPGGNLAASRVYSYLIMPGSANLKYVHPVMSGLTAKDNNGNALTATYPYKSTSNYNDTELKLDVADATSLTLTGTMLQKYTNSTNKTQDNNDKVQIQRMKDGVAVGTVVTAQAGSSYPTGKWTYSNLDITDCDALKIIVTSYVNSSIKRIYTVSLVKAVAEVQTAAVSVGKDLTLNIGAEMIDSKAENAVIKYSYDGVTRESSPVYNEETGLYDFQLTGIIAKYMSAPITINVESDGEVVKTMEYSISSYCEEVKSLTANELGITSEKKVQLDTLMADMLSYGADVQRYTGYNTSSLPDSASWVSECKSSAPTIPASNKSIVMPSTDSNNKVAFTFLNLRSDIQIVFGLKLAEGSKFVVQGSKGTKAEFTRANTTLNEYGYYLAYLPGQAAADLDEVFTGIIYNASGDKVQEVTYSVNSYINTKFNDSDATVANLVKSIYNYEKSALAYKG